MTDRTLRETVAGMKAAPHYQTEFHRGWNGALEAVAALLDAHTAAQSDPDAVAERPLPHIRFGVHSRPINPNDDR